MDHDLKFENPNPRLNASLFSKLFFCWLIPVFRKGRKNDLEPRDFYNVLPKDKSETLGDVLERNWKKEMENAQKIKKKPTFQKAIIKTFKWPIFYLGLFSFTLSVVVKSLQPIALRLLIEHFSPNSQTTKNDAYLYAFFLIFMTTLEAFIFCQIIYAARELGMQLRIACSSLIYRKILRLSYVSSIKASSGLVTNLLSNDVVKFETAFMCLHYLWITPIQIILTSFFVYQNVGVASLAGVLFTVLQTIPFLLYSGKTIHTLRKKVTVRTDRRVQLMNEVINGIRVIKMYTWEPIFEQLISVARRYEMVIIGRANYLKGVLLASSCFTQRAAVFVTIIVYTLQDHDLTADKVYTFLQYFNILQWSINFTLSGGLKYHAEAKVSINRIQKFLLLDEIETRCTPSMIVNNTISVEKVIASWNDREEIFNGITISVPNKNLCTVVGPVGAGKSSFLKLVLGELSPSSGKVFVPGNISYSSQEPWLFPASIKNNILFDQPFEENKYNQVTKACCLLEDFEQLPYGDRTLVGEKGMLLSGGQCARINLARAVYRDADIYLLDDPLSAVDARVSKNLFEKAINGYLKDKTRILVTHQVQFLKHADTILLLEKGKIEYQGNFKGFQKHAKHFHLKEENDSDRKLSVNEKNIKVDVDAPLDMPTSNDNDNLEEPKETQELVAKGNIKNSLYWKYFKANGSYFLLTFTGFLFLVTQIVHSGTDYWLAYWIKKEEAKQISLKDEKMKLIEEERSFDTNRYISLYVYGGLILGSAMLPILRNVLMHTICKRSNTNIHNMMVNCILKAPMQFFDINPSGRILNRFSKDVGAVDELLPRAIVESFQIFSFVFGVLVQILIVNSRLLLPMIIMVVLQLYIKEIYLATAQSVKRLEGNAKSPVLTHANSSLRGLLTIRSCKAEKMVCKQFDSQQDAHTALFSMMTSTMVAYGFWIDLLSLSFISIVTYSFIIGDNQNFSGESVGLAITQVLSICGVVQWGMKLVAEMVSQMVTVERLFQFTKLEQEGPFESEPGTGPSKNWPHEGEIKFENLYLKYTDTDEPVLKSLNFTLEPGMKVGVVGRTGAGKSSLIAALFRLAKIEGNIYIDGVDISRIGLRELRSKLSIIPQEPMLFSASLRDNLDPFHEFDDAALWSALQDVDLKKIFTALDQPVDQSGSNLSAGQRQLLCLARAVIKKSKILILDEATANVDPGTDALIQKTIRLNFNECTVMTIAHRLNTIMDSDKVLVMKFGEAVEFNHPHILLENNGSFAEMVQQTGTAMAEHLKTVAKEAYSTAKKSN